MRDTTTLLFGLDGFRVVRVNVHDKSHAGAPREVLVEGLEDEQACPDCGVLSGGGARPQAPPGQGPAAWACAADAAEGPATLGVSGAGVPAAVVVGVLDPVDDRVLELLAGGPAVPVGGPSSGAG